MIREEADTANMGTAGAFRVCGAPVTVFSTREFVEAWCRFVTVDQRPLAIPVSGSGPRRIMYAFETLPAYGSRRVALAAHYFHASPGWESSLEPTTVNGILRVLMGYRTRGFEWHVRFDHEPLAAELASRGLTFARGQTQVVHLDRDYDRVFARYSTTIRNQVRKARRRGVRVRDGVTFEDVQAFHRVYLQMVREKQQLKSWRWIVYPVELLVALIQIPGAARLILAECEGKIAAGGLFFFDGCSVMYFAGAMDRNYSDCFPLRPVLDEAIKWACGIGARTMDFLGSGGLASLERFKASWGARTEQNWSFRWQSPLWQRVSRLNNVIRTFNVSRSA